MKSFQLWKVYANGDRTPLRRNRTFQLWKVHANGDRTPLRRISAQSLADAQEKVPPHLIGKVVVEPARVWGRHRRRH